MEVSQRGEIQRTHNAGLVVTFVLELLAVILLSILECFFRYTDVFPVRDVPFVRTDDVIGLTEASGRDSMASFAYHAHVPYSMVVALSLCLPLLVVLVCELVRWKLADDHTLHVVAMCCSCGVHTFVRRIIRFTGTFLAGMLTTMLFVDVTKLMVGRLRPVFLEVCQLNRTLCFADDQRCDVVDTCMQTDADMLRWARTSFPSFHAAVTSFSAVFMAIYLQTTIVVNLRCHVLGPFLSLFWVMAALLCALARYALYYSHWTDVVAGCVVGVVVSVYICVFVVEEFEESSDITARRLLDNLQHVWTPAVAVRQQKHMEKSTAPWYVTSWKWNLMEQMEHGGDAGRDVTGTDNRKGDDVISVTSSVGQTTSRDRHVAERMYAYY